MPKSANEQTHPSLNEPAENLQAGRVRVIHPEEFDDKTVQTPGMHRFSAISGSLTNSRGMWAGLTLVDPSIESGPHHHGEQETVIFVKAGYAKIRWGDQLQNEEQAAPGCFIFVPPFMPHQEINPSPDTVSEWVIVRNGPEPVVINLVVPPGGTVS